jgi:DNA-directed RNA polymerase specialized sigma24 family protein
MDGEDGDSREGSGSWMGGAITPSMYAQMRRIARRVLACYPGGCSAHPSSLIHEAVYKLRSYGPSKWKTQHHFMNATRRAMHWALLDRLRAPNGGTPVDLAHACDVCEKDPLLDEMLTVEEAILELEREDPCMRSIVMLKGVQQRTDEATANELGLSTRTVQRKWRYARAYIGTKLQGR